jgi:hypothetical protein
MATESCSDIPLQTFETYRSSEAEDCVALENTPAKEGRIELTLPPRSIVTLYGKAR